MQWKKQLLKKYYEAKRFMLFVAEHFIKDDCTYRASALTFTTLLAVVPLMTVGFTIFSSLPVFQHLLNPLQNFIFENFVPTAGQAIQEYLRQFAAQTTKLSVFGIAILFITALLVMVTIENAMNQIWRVYSARKGVSAFLLYWAILSLAPILLGLSLAASSYFLSIPFIQHQQTYSLLPKSIPFFLSWLGFTFLFVVVPNCSVKIIHGLWGGMVTALLFEAAKQAFAYYLTQYKTYELLYGAFATIPIFFLWVYWGWVITLLGAEISYALSVHYKRREGLPLDGFSHAVLWLYKLWCAQQKGSGLNREELVEASSQPFVIDANEMINTLVRLGLIHHTQQDIFMLSRDLNQISLYELAQNLPFRLPTQSEITLEIFPYTAAWQKVWYATDHALHRSLAISLHQLFNQALHPENLLK
ncbi:MAG: YihY family inner membrane protein [Legionella sp.]|nr:YihY family inner membrane protein [Legionella sp.]